MRRFFSRLGFPAVAATFALGSVAVFAQVQPNNGAVVASKAYVDGLVSGLLSQIAARTQNASAAITGGTINGATIGGTTPAAGAFTTISAAAPIGIASGGTGASSISGAFDTPFGTARGSVPIRGATGWTGYTPPTSGCTFQFNGLDTVCATASPGTGALRFDAVQSLTPSQQDQARANVSSAVPATPSASATLATTDIDRAQSATGTITLTVPNGGAGWRTGAISNANLQAGLITLAVPSAATLDGVANGTTVLYPYQRARIVQTGAAAYVTEWLDRSPTIAARAITTAAAQADFAMPVGYTAFRVSVTKAHPGTAGTSLLARFSYDSSTFYSGATDYSRAVLETTSGTAPANGAASGIEIATPIAGGPGMQVADLLVSPGATNDYPALTSRAQFLDNTGVYAQYVSSGIITVSVGRASTLRLAFGSGTGTMAVSIQGVP